VLEWWGRKLGFSFIGFLLPIFCLTAAAASSFVAAAVCVGFGGGIRGRGAERPCSDLIFFLLLILARKKRWAAFVFRTLEMFVFCFGSLEMLL
jgi:hypothetical protein